MSSHGVLWHTQQARSGGTLQHHDILACWGSLSSMVDVPLSLTCELIRAGRNDSGGICLQFSRDSFPPMELQTILVQVSKAKSAIAVKWVKTR